MNDICLLTKCDIPVSHPRSNSDLFIRDEPRDLFASEEIPDESGLTGVVADDKPAGMPLTRVVGLDPEDILPMSRKATVDGQSVVAKA